MHAYNRMEADQTDSIAVCGSREEWEAVYDAVFGEGPWPVTLVDELRKLGVGEE